MESSLCTRKQKKACVPFVVTSLVQAMEYMFLVRNRTISLAQDVEAPNGQESLNITGNEKHD